MHNVGVLSQVGYAYWEIHGKDFSTSSDTRTTAVLLEALESGSEESPAAGRGGGGRLPPYHVLNFIRLRKLWRTGGIFSDFSFFFLGAMDSSAISQVNAIINCMNGFFSFLPPLTLISNALYFREGLLLEFFLFASGSTRRMANRRKSPPNCC
jgi:hypothetical protein